MPRWRAACRLQFGFVWLFQPALGRTSCKEGDSNADTSQKAALPKHRFAFFGWDYSIRAFIHPLSAEDPSTKMFCRMKSRSCKKMHPFEVLSFTGLGGFFSSFPI